MSPYVHSESVNRHLLNVRSDDSIATVTRVMETAQRSFCYLEYPGIRILVDEHLREHLRENGHMVAVEHWKAREPGGAKLGEAYNSKADGGVNTTPVRKGIPVNGLKRVPYLPCTVR